jgi:hypothetical protein
MEAKTTAGQGTLNYRDLAKGAIMTVIGAVLTTIYSALDTGGFDTINWRSVLTVAAISGIGYLIKNLFTPTQIVIENPPKTVVKAVNEGESKVTVTPK